MKSRLTHLIFLSLLIVHIQYTYSQKDYKVGYIVTYESDTVSGLLNDVTPHKKHRFAKFKKDRNDHTVSYAAHDIKGYGFEDGRMYSSKYLELSTGDTGYFFVQPLVKGSVSLYKVFNSYLLTKDSINYIELYKKKYQVESSTGTGGSKKYSKTEYTYITQLRTSLGDCPTMVSQLIQEVSLNDKSLTPLVQDYNRCKNYPLHSYSPPRIKSKLELELRGGVLHTLIKAPYSHYVQSRNFNNTNTYTVYLWRRRENFEGNWRPLYGLALKFFLKEYHSGFIQTVLSYSSASTNRGRESTHPNFVYDEVTIEYSTLNIKVGAGNRFHFGKTKIDFSLGAALHNMRNIQSTSFHEVEGLDEIFSDPNVTFEDYLTSSEIRYSGWAELSIVPFTTKLGDFLLGANYHFGARTIPVKSEFSGLEGYTLEGYTNLIRFNEFGVFTGIRI